MIDGGYHPDTHTLYVNSMDVGMIYRMTPRPEGATIPYRPQGFGTPNSRFWDPKLNPCQKPPWGHLTAIDLDRGSAIGSVETMAEAAWRHGRQPLGKLDRGTMRESGQHDVLQRVELVDDRGVDRRVSVTEQIDPPGADRVQISVAVEIVQPRAAAARDWNERQGLVLLHLRARMPDGGAAARNPVLVAGHGGQKSEASILHRATSPAHARG